MLSSQPVHRLSGLCMNSIVDTPAAFLMQPYCHLLRQEGTTSHSDSSAFSALSCSFCLSFFCLSVFHFVFVNTELHVVSITIIRVATGQGREALCVLTGCLGCGCRGLFSLDQQLHVVGSQNDLFLTFTLSHAE